MNNGTNALMILKSEEFNNYDSIDGEFSIQINKGDNNSNMAMRELGSMMRGVSVTSWGEVMVAHILGSKGGTSRTGLNGHHNNERLWQIKLEDSDPTFEDSNNHSYDYHAGCSSIMNCKWGISMGDILAILLGGQSDAYNSGSEDWGNYVLRGTFLASGLGGNHNTSFNDTMGDLFAWDDNSLMSTVRPYANLQDSLDMGEVLIKWLGPFGDELLNCARYRYRHCWQTCSQQWLVGLTEHGIIVKFSFKFRIDVRNSFYSSCNCHESK